MNASNDPADLPAEVQGLIEERREAFESAWRRGESPSPEAALNGFEGEAKSLLLRELVRIEQHYRFQQTGRSLGDEPWRQERLQEESPAGVSDTTMIPVETQFQTSVGASDITGAFRPSAQFAGFPVRFGRYRLIRPLGTGGMGSVYLAEDTLLERRVALKLPQFHGDAESELVTRFYREAKAAAALRHANLCAVYDVGEVNGVHFLTMEYIEGCSLADELAGGRCFTDRESLRLVRTIALALQNAHQKGVVHRDIKPANIMIDRHGEPTITDFGLARRLEGDATQLTRAGEILGTPAYMPPEQIRGDLEKLGPASDIYSLGVVLYELLTGQKPFRGTLVKVLEQIVASDPPPMSDHRDSVAPEVEAICRKMMARQLENRYESMEAVAAAIRNALPAADPPTATPPLRRR
ncbi:MAG: serine/threonine-protein kinase [Pirellulaceae bacterium]